MSKYTGWLLVTVCVLVLCGTVNSSAEGTVKIGDTLEDVIRVLGEPVGQFTAGNKKTLYFEKGLVLMKDEKVIKVELKTKARVAPASPEKQPAAPRAKAHVAAAGDGMSARVEPEETAPPPEKTQAEKALAEIDAKIKKVKAGIAEANHAANKNYIRGGSRRRKSARIKRAKLQEELKVLLEKKKAL